MDIAAIGRDHLAAALRGKMYHCVVSEWLDDGGEPVKIYWRALTGTQQKYIDSFTDTVSRTCAVVKMRALDENGARVFKDIPIESLVNDYDYTVIRAIAYLMATQTEADIDEQIEVIEKE